MPLDNNFLKQVGPETGAILWITEVPLAERPSHFVEVNYLLDGLLESSLEEGRKQKGLSFFQSHSFGRIFLVGILESSAELLSGAKQFLDIIKKDGKNCEVLTIGINEQKRLSKLSQKYSHITFKSFLKN